MPKHDDHTRQGWPVFDGPPVPFSEAFPQIADFRMEVEERTLGGPHPLSQHSFSLHHLPPGRYLPCSNHLCRDGGFRIIVVLHEMVHSRKTELEETVACIGHENMGRPQTRRCLHSVKVTAHVTYKDGE